MINYLKKLDPMKMYLSAIAGFCVPLLVAIANHHKIDASVLANAILASGGVTTLVGVNPTKNKPVSPDEEVSGTS